MSTREKAHIMRGVVRRHIKQINRWRGLNVGWKCIAKQLNIECDYRTLAKHYYGRGAV